MNVTQKIISLDARREISRTCWRIWSAVVGDVITPPSYRVIYNHQGETGK